MKAWPSLPPQQSGSRQVDIEPQVDSHVDAGRNGFMRVRDVSLTHKSLDHARVAVCMARACEQE